MDNSSFYSKLQEEISNFHLQTIDEDVKEKQIVKFSSGTNSALYIDGQLDTWGSEGEVQNRLESLFSVYVINSDDFMLGGEDLPSPTLEYIQEYQQDRLDALTKAKELVDEANSLLNP